MIQPKSIIIGLSISIILIKCFKYSILESELWSFLFYTVGFSFLYEMISNEKKDIVVEGYTTNNKNVQFVEFEESETFKGKRDGYVFKKDEKGLGYYLDK